MAPKKKTTAKKKTAKKTTAKKKPAKKATKKKNSLVGNINKRKKAGTSRPKSRSTVTREAFSEMKKGWPKTHRPRTSPGRKQSMRSKPALT